MKPQATHCGRSVALTGCAITLLLCGVLSCAPPNVASVARWKVPDAAASGGSRDGGLAFSVPDADSPADAEGGSAAAGADVACPLDLGVVFDPVNPVEEGGDVSILDRGAQLLWRAVRGVTREGGSRLLQSARMLEQIVANTMGDGEPSGLAQERLYRLATTEAVLGAWAHSARARAGLTEAAAACAALEKEASDRAIAAYSQLRAEVAGTQAPDGGVDSPPRSQEVLELLAFEYRLANDPVNSRRIYSELLARGLPAAVAAGRLGLGDLACAAAGRGDARQWDMAIAEYRRAVQASPPAPERRYAWYRLGCALRRRGDVRGALDAFERAAVRATSHADLVGTVQERANALSALKATYAEAGTPTGAFESFRRVSDDPGLSRGAMAMMAELATEYVRLGRTREAAAAFRELVARDPANRCAWLERRALGAEIAGRSSLTFLARVPEDFRGRIQPAERAGPPSAYAVVSDGERFVVLRSTPTLRALQGQSVVVARDNKGRLVVRADPDKDIGR
ncbi:MAG: hypothetical protein WBY94_00825 [Polyangiaceae bacterium]